MAKLVVALKKLLGDSRHHPPTGDAKRRGDPQCVEMKIRYVGPAAGVGALAGAALWWRTHPSACPYSQRFWVEAPHPLITRSRLRDALGPVSGERLLEIGPGTGYYSLPVAKWL